MKKLLLIFTCVITLLLLFISCDVGIEKDNIVYVEEIRVRTFSPNMNPFDNTTNPDAPNYYDPLSNMHQYSLLETSDINPRRITGKGEARFTVRVDVLPENAPYGVYAISDEPAVWYDNALNQIAANDEVVLAKLTFYSVGLMANGKRATYEVFIRSDVIDTSRMVEWTFSVVPDGWVAGTGNANYTPNVQYADSSFKGHFMTLNCTTVTMAIDGTRLRLGTAGREWGTIDGFSGPVRILIDYTMGGSGSTRFPYVTIGSSTYNQSGDLSAATDSNANATLDFRHPGGGPVTIRLFQTGGIYVRNVSVIEEW